LVADASARRKFHAHSPSNFPAQPHLLPPSALLAAHLAPILAHEQSQLNARLQTLQSQNSQLSRAVTVQREEMAVLLEGVVATVQDLQGAVEGMHGSEGDGMVGQLAAETSDVEREMSAIMADY
jgi:kinetochore protein NNF1